MNYLILWGLLIMPFSIIYAQDEIEYNNPPQSVTEYYKIGCRDIISTEKYCKFKLIIDNPSRTNYLVYNLEEVGFEYNNIGTYYPVRGKNLVIEPNKQESKVVKIDGDMDYRVPSFHLRLNGLSLGTPTTTTNLPSLPLEENQVSSEKGISVTCLKFSSKKGKAVSTIEFLFEGEENHLLEIDPSKLVLSDNAGNSIDIGVNKTKKVTLLTGEKHKLTLAFESTETAFQLSSENVFQLFELNAIAVDKIKVLDPKANHDNDVVLSEVKGGENRPTVTVGKDACEGVSTAMNAPVRTKILAEDGVCFTLKVDGQTIVDQYTSSAIFYLNYAGQRLELTLSNGTKIKKDIFVSDHYQAIGYRLKQNKKGEFVLNYALFDQQLSEKGEIDRVERAKKLDQQMERNRL